MKQALKTRDPVPSWTSRRPHRWQGARGGVALGARRRTVAHPRRIGRYACGRLWRTVGVADSSQRPEGLSGMTELDITASLEYDHTRSMTMSPTERVTITLPQKVVREIDRIEKNRSRFVLEAVRRELLRRRREELRRSLASPHAEIEEYGEAGFEDWARSLPDEDVSGLVDLTSGTPVRWAPGAGWVREDE